MVIWMLAIALELSCIYEAALYNAINKWDGINKNNESREKCTCNL